MNDDRELDAALRRVMTIPQDDNVPAQRIVRRLVSAALPPQKRTVFWWPSALTDRTFAPAWPRVAALACAAVLGISVGLSSFGMRVAANLDLVRVASADDAASNVFDVDLGVGIRP